MISLSLYLKIIRSNIITILMQNLNSEMLASIVLIRRKEDCARRSQAQPDVILSLRLPV